MSRVSDLIHHNTIGCLEPNQNIKHFQNRIKELQTKTKLTLKDSEEITRLEKKIEAEKQRKPWRWGLYCVEHLYHEPRETFLRLTKILRDREIEKMRKEHNGGKEMFFDCSECFKKVSDTQICEDKQERIICQNCYANSQRQKAKINL